MVDVGDDAVEVGDEVVLIGRAGRRRGHRRRSGPSGWARSRTRSSAASGRGRRGGTADGGPRGQDARAGRGRRGDARRRGLRGRAGRRRRGSGATTTRTSADDLVPAFDEIRSLPSHDGGSISVDQPGRGAADRALARRDALGADLGEADGVAARRPGSGRSRSTIAVTAHRRSATGGHTLEHARRRRADASSKVSTCTTRCSSVTRWAASRCSSSASATRRSRPSGSPASCCSRRCRAPR